MIVVGVVVVVGGGVVVVGNYDYHHTHPLTLTTETARGRN